MIEILLFLGLFTKHFVIDFLMQGPYQWQNKGTYGHMGGIVHSTLHAAGTLIVFSFVVSFPFALALAALDLVAHYHIDWAKMNINKKFGWGANTHEEFWWLLGLDQYLHQLTYIALVAIAI